jgi:O-antigen/teichoic acid export membrane protein
MSTVRTIAKNTGVLLVAQVASYLLSFFYMMYTARYLGTAGFGILSFALAFTGIFAVFADLGLSTLTVREVARDKSLAPKYLANVSLMKIILVAITFGLIALTINLMGYPEETIKVVYLLALFVIFTGFTQMFYSIFQAYERMEFQSIGQMLNAALLLGGVIFAMKQGFSVIGFAFLFFIASVIVLCYSFAVMKLKFSNPASASATKAIELDWSFWKRTIKQALPFGLSGVAASIYYYTDSVMLSLMQGDAAVGLYNAPYRLVQALLFIPVAFNLSLFPVMSRLYETSKESLEFACERSFKYMALLAIPIGIGITLLANRFILLVYGSEYALSAIALQILVWSIVMMFLGSSFGTLLGAANRQQDFLKVLGIAAILNVLLNILLIPRYGYAGAGIATVITQFINALGLFLYARKYHKIEVLALAKIILKVLASSLVMAVFIHFFHAINLLLLIPASALIYFAVVFFVRAFDQSDMSFVKQLISGMRR